MTKELKFYDQGFEEVVRCELHIADRPITEEDALKAHVLDCLDFSLILEIMMHCPLLKISLSFP